MVEPPVPPSTAVRHALVAEAARRSRVCWLSWAYDGQGTVRERLVWHVWHDDAVVVVSCPPGSDDNVVEQHLPGLDGSSEVVVTLRSRDTGGRLISWPAPVEVAEPGTPAWEEHVTALLGVRLNLPDPAATRRAWAERGTVVRLATPLP